jgi:hypothetical protein
MGSEKPEGRPDSLKEPYYESWDAGKLQLFRDATGRLRLTVEGDRSFLEVKVVRVFPLTDPDHYMAFLDAKGRDKIIGVVVDPDELDGDSRAAAHRSLGRHYFVPTITRIHSMTEEFGAIYCDVETDRGPRQFVGKGLRDAIEHLGDGELMIPDVDGNRYHVADWRGLDARSRRLLERVV